jgi:hypothetical protein
MNDRKTDWPLWVAVAGAVWLAVSVSHTAPTLVEQGGLSPMDWGKSLLPLLAFVPKLIDLFKTDKTAFTKITTGLAALEVVARTVPVDDEECAEAVKVLREKIVEPLGVEV